MVHSVEQKSIGLKFCKSRTGSHVTYICHHISSRFTFPIFAHSWPLFSIHGWKRRVGNYQKLKTDLTDNTVVNPLLSGGRIPLPFRSYSQQA